jgi:hypothetical protein
MAVPRSDLLGRGYAALIAALVAGALSMAALPSIAGAAVATDEMTRCAQLGPKRPGNDAGRRMAARLAKRFRAAGLRTSVEDFHMPLFVVRRVSLQVVGEGARAVPGETFAYGGTGTADARVVDVGVGRPADYTGKDVSGAIVMVRRDVAFHRSSQYREVITRGGVAMLYVSGTPRNLVQTGAVRFAREQPGPIPAVTVGADEGAALRRQIESAGLRMRVEVHARREDSVGRNVIGLKRGTRYPKRVIVLGGHYDSWYDGAVDNCSSVGSLLGVLDAVKGRDFPYTVVFAGWDGEEPGLTGAYDWVAHHPTLTRRAVVNENFEMTASMAGTGQLVFGTGSPVLEEVVDGAAAENGYSFGRLTAAAIREVSGGIIPTDLQPFYSSGVQGFSTFSSTPWYHTTQDTADKVDSGALERSTAFLHDVFEGLLGRTPAELAVREVPKVRVSAPKRARPGARLKVEISVTSPDGESLSGGPVTVVADQRDNWAVSQGTASDLGDGRYRYVVPAGATEADRTLLTVRIDRPQYLGEGFAHVDQRAGGILRPAPYTCAPTRSVALAVRSPRRGVLLRRVRASATRGQASVRGSVVRVSGLGTSRDAFTVRVFARTRGGSLVRQKRTYPPCATAASIRRAIAGM